MQLTYQYAINYSHSPHKNLPLSVGDVMLSVAPRWVPPIAQHSPQTIPWRDHWMQAAYFLPPPPQPLKDPNSLYVGSKTAVGDSIQSSDLDRSNTDSNSLSNGSNTKVAGSNQSSNAHKCNRQVLGGENLVLTAVRDEYSLWFSVAREEPTKSDKTQDSDHESSLKTQVSNNESKTQDSDHESKSQDSDPESAQKQRDSNTATTVKQPHCTCSVHRTNTSFGRMAQLSDTDTLGRLSSVLDDEAKSHCGQVRKKEIY